MPKITPPFNKLIAARGGTGVTQGSRKGAAPKMPMKGGKAGK